MNIDNTIECKRILSHINKQVCEVSVKFNKNQVSRVLYSLFLENFNCVQRKAPYEEISNNRKPLKLRHYLQGQLSGPSATESLPT